MIPVSTAFLDAIRNGGTVEGRVTLLDEDDTEIEELTGADGWVLSVGVSMDRTRQPRRTVNMTISNPHGIWTPRALAGELWLRKRFRVEYGFVIGGVTERVSLGHFVVDRPRAEFGEDKVLTVSGSDYWKLGYKRKPRQTLVFHQSQRLEELVRTIGTMLGFDPARMRLDDSQIQLTADLVVAYGSDLPAELLKIVAAYAHEVYLAGDGWLVLGPLPTDASIAATAPAYALSEGADAVLLSVTKEWSDDQLYNAVVVVAQAAQRATVSAEARDLNPLSPAYNPLPHTDPNWWEGGPMGDRMLPVEFTSRVSDQYACQMVADAMLFEVTLIEESYDLKLGPVPMLEPGDVVSLIHAESDTNDTLLIDAIQLGTSEADDQSLSIKKVRRLS